jgi:hypothetical protein
MNIICLVLFSALTHLASPLNCFTNPFPKVLGGFDGLTSFNDLDVHVPTGDLVAVGHTEDSGVKGACATALQSPIIVYYSGVSLRMAWGKVFGISRMAFMGVTISADGLSIAVHTHNIIVTLD